jgi:PKD repeat protein
VWTDELGNLVGNGFDITVNPTVTTQYIATLASCGFSSDTATVTVGEVAVQIGNDTSICQGDSLVIDAGNTGAAFNWSNGSTAQVIVVNAPGTYSVVVSNGNCYGTDSLQLTLVPCPISQSFFGSTTTSVCQKFCISFFDSSSNNPTSWLWLFPGGTPSSSTSQNPPPICYNTSGTFDVTLITTSGTGIDTLLLPGYITVYPTAAFPVIVVSQNNDTLTSSPASTYQWQFNSIDIPGATNQSCIITQTGLYGVTITDQNGCLSSSTAFVVLNGIYSAFSGSNVSLYPNPSNGKFVVKGWSVIVMDEFAIEVINLLGQIIYSSKEKFSASFEKAIDLRKYGSGCFFLRIGVSSSAGEIKDAYVIKKIITGK